MLLDILAYPALLAAMIGALHVGRDEPSRLFEWMRLVTLAALLGSVIALQVILSLAGRVDSAFTLGAGVVSVAGMVLLLGLHVVERQASPRPLLPLPT